MRACLILLIAGDWAQRCAEPNRTGQYIRGQPDPMPQTYCGGFAVGADVGWPCIHMPATNKLPVFADGVMVAWM
jgi:hypothetical protein